MEFLNYMIFRHIALATGLLCLILCCARNAIRADDHKPIQQNFDVVVDTIIIEGANVTKPFIISREMTIRVGDRITPELMEENQKRIQNLGLFTSVELEIRHDNQQNQLWVIVTEEWYIFPLPFWRKEGGDFSKITYGLQYLQKNFRGRNERVSASVWMGFEEGYQLAYYNPWFAGHGTWGLAADAFKVISDVNNTKYRRLGAEINAVGGRGAIQRRFGMDTRLTVTFGFTRYQTEYHELMIANDNHDNWLSLGVAFLSDRRDLYEYPSHGWFQLINLAGSSLLNGPKSADKTVMAIGSLELRHYQQTFFDLILCERGLLAVTAGDVPLYRRYFLGSGYDTNVRGWRGEIEEGEGVFFGSIEIRRHLYDVHYFTWKSAPIAKRYFRNLKYGLSGGLFADLGQVWIKPGEASYRRFQAGWGAGLHLHLPYLDILRVEAAWSPESSFQDAKISIRSRVAF
jgi:outer membrane protein assembly factor BamA